MHGTPYLQLPATHERLLKALVSDTVLYSTVL
jgi:hypothetical protein